MCCSWTIQLHNLNQAGILMCCIYNTVVKQKTIWKIRFFNKKYIWSLIYKIAFQNKMSIIFCTRNYLKWFTFIRNKFCKFDLHTIWFDWILFQRNDTSTVKASICLRNPVSSECRHHGKQIVYIIIFHLLFFYFQIDWYHKICWSNSVVCVQQGCLCSVNRIAALNIERKKNYCT